MWPLLEKVLDPELPLKDKVTYLHLINHTHKLRFEKDAEIAFMKDKIQELISSPVTRFEGYIFMDALLTNHPTAYVHNWGPIIIGSLKCSDSYVSKKLTLRILTLVVVNFSGNKSYEDAFKRFMPEILGFLLEVQHMECEFLYCCRTLVICMQHIPSILGLHYGEIEMFLLKHLDSPSHEVIEAISDCFTALPVCLGKFQVPKLSFTEIWGNVCLKTLNTLQGLLNDILIFLEVENPLVNLDGLDLFKIPFDDNEGEVSYVLTRVRIFSTLCKCLEKLMKVEYKMESTRIGIPVDELLQCLERIFQVKEIIEVKQVSKCSAYLLAYPIMQNAVLDVLGALIVNFTIIEQSGNFAKLLKESIAATTVTTFTQSSLRKIRSTTWKTLNIWLKQYGPKGSYEIVNDRFLIQELFKDIELDSENEHSQTNGTMELLTDTFSEECCFEALQVVQTIFTTGGSYIDKGLVNEISTTIFKTVRKIQPYLHPAKKFPYPYSNEKCRIQLYESLLSGSLFGDPMQTKFINQAINLFKIAMKDPNLEINILCHKAFKLCRFFLNPKKPPPEASTCSGVKKSGWVSGDSDKKKEDTQEENSLDVAPPCHIENVFHDSVQSSSQRDLVQNVKTPVHIAYENQCNGKLMSDKTSHTSTDNGSGSDIEVYKNLEETPFMLPVDIHSIAQTSINSIDPQISEPISIHIEPKIIELRTLEPVQEKIAVTNNDSSATDFPINCIDDVEEEEEEISPSQSHRRMVENGMDIDSEDESDEEAEEGTGSDEEEENNEAPSPKEKCSTVLKKKLEQSDLDRCSSEELSESERPLQKKQKTSHGEELPTEGNRDEKSSNQTQEITQDEEVVTNSEEEEVEEEEEEERTRSPTVNEMCQDFFLIEPEDMA